MDLVFERLQGIRSRKPRLSRLASLEQMEREYSESPVVA